MVVGDNESTATKNSGKSMANLIAMAIQRYDVGRFVRWSTSTIHGFTRSHWMPPSVACSHCIAPAPVAAMVKEFESNTQNTNKTQLLASNGYISIASCL